MCTGTCTGGTGMCTGGTGTRTGGAGTRPGGAGTRPGGTGYMSWWYWYTYWYTYWWYWLHVLVVLAHVLAYVLVDAPCMFSVLIITIIFTENPPPPLSQSQIGVAAAEHVAGLKVVEAGLSREKIALIAVPMVPLQILLPFLIRYMYVPIREHVCVYTCPCWCV